MAIVEHIARKAIIIIVHIGTVFGVLPSVQAQPTEPLSYARADSIALNWSFDRIASIETLALGLTSGSTSDDEKFRTLFRWVAHNIAYQFGASGKDPLKVLRRKKAVCEGYASLLQALCQEAAIECVTIQGLAKSMAREHIDGDQADMRHAWNAVELDGAWHLVDVTWAAGGVDMRTRKFTRAFEAGWFLTDPAQFALSHWPEDAQWMLGIERPERKDFIQAPVYYRWYSVKGLRLESPRKGRIGRHTVIRIRSEAPLSPLSAYVAEADELLTLPVKTTGDRHTVQLDLPKDLRGPVIIKMDGEWLFAFNRE